MSLTKGGSALGEPFGFILVTSDPDLVNGRRGHALDLVMARLSKKAWPLYDGTRNRARIVEGSRVAFYVAGSARQAGQIVAAARIAGRRRHRQGAEGVDPPEFATERPYIILDLGDIELLEKPVVFREKLEMLSLCPVNLKRWGVILMGGSRAVSAADWKILFGARAGPRVEVL